MAASLQPNSDARFSSLPWLQKAITVVMDTYADLDKLVPVSKTPMSKVERNGSPSTWLITVQSFLYLDKCKYIKC